MNNKRTPGFCEIELTRSRNAYQDMCVALARAQDLAASNPNFKPLDLKRVEDDYFSSMNDYFIANENFSNSENDVVMQSMAMLESSKHTITWFERFKKFIRCR